MWNSPALYIAAKAYMQVAMSQLAKTVSAIPSAQQYGVEDWLPSDDAFVRGRKEVPSWQNAIIDLRDLLYALNEYKQLVSVISGNSLVTRYIEISKRISGGSHLTAEELADRFLWQMAERGRGFEFNTEDFDELFQRFEAELVRDSVRYALVAPLPGLKLDYSVNLEPYLDIAPLSDKELTRCMKVSLFPGIVVDRIVLTSSKYGLRYCFSESIHDLTVEVEQLGRLKQIATKFIEVIHALRLFKRGTISIPGIALLTDDYLLRESVTGWIIDPRAAHRNNYELAESETEQFKKIWELSRSEDISGSLSASLRRFAFAGERQRLEDRLVDLMIAAESLFLSGTTEPKERGEMRFRLALRAAFFVQLEDYTRREMFGFMLSAYDGRSAVVHGSLPSEKPLKTLKLPRKGRVSLAEFVSFTEDVLRAALQKALRIRPFSKNSLVDWDSLILDRDWPFGGTIFDFF
jgi:hypothetical protein